MDIQQHTPLRSRVGTLSIKDVWPELRTFSRRDSGSILGLAFAQQISCLCSLPLVPFSKQSRKFEVTLWMLARTCRI